MNGVLRGVTAIIVEETFAVARSPGVPFESRGCKLAGMSKPVRTDVLIESVLGT